jgi:hypothetical protein
VKYPILKAGRIPVDAKKVAMKNWAQYIGRWGPARIQLNPRSVIVIIPKTLGYNPWQIGFEAWDLSNEVAASFQEKLGMKLGRGQFQGWGRGRAHFEVSGDPVAESVGKHVVVESETGTIGDASPPHQDGSISLYTPRTVGNYLHVVTGLRDEIDALEEQIKLLAGTTRDGFKLLADTMTTELSKVREVLPGRIASAVAEGVQSGLREFQQPPQGRLKPDRPDYS